MAHGLHVISRYLAMLLLTQFPSTFAWRPETQSAEPEKQVLDLVASGHVHVAGHRADAVEHQRPLGAAPDRLPVPGSLAQLAKTEPHHSKRHENRSPEVPTNRDIEAKEVKIKGTEYVTVKQCENVADVMRNLVGQERHIEVFCMIGGTIAFLIALIMSSIWIGMRVKPAPPRYWNNGAKLFFSTSNDFDDEFDVTDKMVPIVQKLVDMTTCSHLLGVGHDASWQTHKRFKVTKVIRIESGRHWTQYATARNVTQPYADSLKEMPSELSKEISERWNKIRSDHAEREKDPVVGPFLKKLGLDSSRNEMMLFHGSPLAGARNRSGQVIFPTEAQAPMNAIKKTGFDERLGNAKGMLGAGTYFGDHIAKADSYAGRYHEWPDGKDPGSVGETAAMFLSRVAIGTPYISTQSLEQLRRPPCLKGHFDANLCGCELSYGEPWPKKGVELEVCEHARFDAVIADPPMTDGHPWATEFREFVLYEKRCYPEFLFYYERLAE